MPQDYDNSRYLSNDSNSKHEMAVGHDADFSRELKKRFHGRGIVA